MTKSSPTLVRRYWGYWPIFNKVCPVGDDNGREDDLSSGVVVWHVWPHAGDGQSKHIVQLLTMTCSHTLVLQPENHEQTTKLIQNIWRFLHKIMTAITKLFSGNINSVKEVRVWIHCLKKYLYFLYTDLDIQGFIEVAAGHDIHYDRSDSFMHYNRQSGPWDKLNIKAEDSLEVTDALCTPRWIRRCPRQGYFVNKENCFKCCAKC